MREWVDLIVWQFLVSQCGCCCAHYSLQMIILYNGFRSVPTKSTVLAKILSETTVCEVSALLNSAGGDGVWRSAAHSGLSNDEIQILSSLQRFLILAAESKAAELYHILNLTNEVFPVLLHPVRLCYAGLWSVKGAVWGWGFDSLCGRVSEAGQ